MKLRLLHSRLRDLLHQRNLLLSLVVSLLLINFFQALYLFVRSERIIVIPPDIKQDVWIERRQVSASYLEEMGLFFANLILESSPESAAYKRDLILRNTTSEEYGSLKAKLLEDENRLKKEHLTTSFQANSVKVNSKKLSVEITGDLLHFVGEKRVSQSRDSYQFEFIFRHGRLLIKAFKLIKSESQK